MRYAKHALAAAIFTLASQANANLLRNPGAEAGDLTGWTVGGVSNPTVDDGSFDPGISPHSGNYHFLGNHGAFGSLTQRVSLAGAPGANTAFVSYWEQGLDQGTPSDRAYVSLTFLDAAGSAIGSTAAPALDASNGTWGQYSGAYAIPIDAFYIDYTMHFARNFGWDLDAFVDDNSLTVGSVPLPGSLPLFGLGALMAATALRRRRVR